MPPQRRILGRLFLQTPLFYRVLYFLLPSLNRSPYSPLPLHYQPPACRYHVPFVLSLQMPKPPWPTPFHHLCHPRYTQTFPQIDTSIPCLQRHPTHPSHHHHLRPVQSLHVLLLHRPRFAPIYQHLLHAHPINLPLQPQKSSPPLQNSSQLTELCPCTPNSSNLCICRPPLLLRSYHPSNKTYSPLLPHLPAPPSILNSSLPSPTPPA